MSETREPLEQDERTTLEAELRRAVQHRHAAQEQLRDTQREVEALVARARELIERSRGEREEAGRPAP